MAVSVKEQSVHVRIGERFLSPSFHAMNNLFRPMKILAPEGSTLNYTFERYDRIVKPLHFLKIVLSFLTKLRTRCVSHQDPQSPLQSTFANFTAHLYSGLQVLRGRLKLPSLYEPVDGWDSVVVSTSKDKSVTQPNFRRNASLRLRIQQPAFR